MPLQLFPAEDSCMRRAYLQVKVNAHLPLLEQPLSLCFLLFILLIVLHQYPVTWQEPELAQHPPAEKWYDRVSPNHLQLETHKPRLIFGIRLQNSNMIPVSPCHHLFGSKKSTEHKAFAYNDQQLSNLQELKWG
jgi:hypothetical protein